MAASSSDTFESLGRRYGPAYRWLVVFTCLTAMLGMVLSSVSMNVAIPSVMGAFGVGQDKAQWIATGSLASMVIGMLLNAWLVAALGQRATLMIIITNFAFASVLGALSTSIEMLIIARVLQGISAGVMQPFSMMINFQIFPPERRGTAMGIFGMGVVLAPVFGPLLGGIAIDTLGWRYIFVMPAPLIVVAAILGPIFMPQRANSGPLPPFDWTGLGLLAAALAFTLSALTSGQRLGWLSDDVLGLGVIGVTLACAFVLWELRAKRPLLDFTLFKNPRFACAMAVSFTFGVCMFGSSYVMPVFTQIIQGYSAMRAGWLLAIGGSVMILMFPISGRVADTFPPHLLIVSGLLTFAVGFVVMHNADVNTGFWWMAAISAMTRVGLAWVLTPLNATSLRYVPPEKLASASGNTNFFRQLGGGMGIAILVSILETRTTFHATSLSATQTPSNLVSAETVERVSGMLATTGIPETVRDGIALNYLSQTIHSNASMFGYQDVFLVLAAITLVAAIPAWFLRKPNPVTARIHPATAQSAPPETLPALPPLTRMTRRLLHRRQSHRNPAPVLPVRHVSRR